jgi:hypothetical protein
MRSMRARLRALSFGLAVGLLALSARAQEPAASASATPTGGQAPPTAVASKLPETAGATPRRAFAARPIIAGVIAMLFLVLGAYAGRADKSGVKSRRGPTLKT